MKGLLHPAADEEFAAAVQYYTDIDPDLGFRFYREIERLIANVCDHPERNRQFDPPARRHFSFEFPFALVYRLLARETSKSFVVPAALSLLFARPAIPRPKAQFCLRVANDGENAICSSLIKCRPVKLKRHVPWGSKCLPCFTLVLAQ